MTERPHLELVPPLEDEDELPLMTAGELLQRAVELARLALDAAHADGFAVPPMAASSLAGLGLAAVVLAGQEAQRAGEPDAFASSMAAAEKLRAKLAPDAPPIGRA